MSERKDATRVVTAGRREEWTRGIVSPPVWRASTILYETVGDLRAAGARDTHHRLFYGRRGTPTQWSLADALTELEPGAEATLLYPSGVAAVSTALLAVLSPGDHLLLADSVYDPTRNFANGMLKRFGVETSYYDPMIGAGIADLVQDNTRAIFMESPGSLTFEKPIVKRAKLPIGSTVTHEFHYRGQRIKELYVVRPDHSLKLTWRSASSSR